MTIRSGYRSNHADVYDDYGFPYGTVLGSWSTTPQPPYNVQPCGEKIELTAYRGSGIIRQGVTATLTLAESLALRTRLYTAEAAARANGERIRREAEEEKARYSDPKIIALYEAAIGEDTFDAGNEFDRLAYDRIKAAR